MKEDPVLPSDCQMGTTVFHGDGFCAVSDLEAGVVAYAQLVDAFPPVFPGFIVGKSLHLTHLPWFKATGPNNKFIQRTAPPTHTKQALHAAAVVLLRWSRGG